MNGRKLGVVGLAVLVGWVVVCRVGLRFVAPRHAVHARGRHVGSRSSPRANGRSPPTATSATPAAPAGSGLRSTTSRCRSR